MKQTPVRVRMSSNERGSERHIALANVLNRHPERYGSLEWVNTDDLKIDLQIGDAGFELKERNDYILSMFNGHLAEQRRSAAAMGIPCCVPVFASPVEVMEAIPTQGPNGYKTNQEMRRDMYRIIKGDAALTASNFAPAYLGSDYDLAMELIVARAMAINSETIALPGAKAETVQNAMMRCLPRVGPTLADAMEAAGIRVALVANVVRRHSTGEKTTEFTVIRDPGLLRIVPGMGPITARGIIEALR